MSDAGPDLESQRLEAAEVIKTNLLSSWRYGRSMADIYLWLQNIGVEPMEIRECILFHMDANRDRIRKRFQVQ